MRFAEIFKIELFSKYGQKAGCYINEIYDIISDEEKKSLITYLIKEIQIYPNGESEQPLKSIEFNFPIYRDGQEVRRLLWEKGNTVETVCLLSRKAPV
ncbi:hypothetical protein [Clostridium sp. OF09-36]|uniref:hypothetical protein n=1 Tax=Clostridium sp. OF09-36 TaxID=2292310 RepID=UPI00242AE9D6|nr:hypothetical protein [Clostridium sp. OF09-36]